MLRVLTVIVALAQLAHAQPGADEPLEPPSDEPPEPEPDEPRAPAPVEPEPMPAELPQPSPPKRTTSDSLGLPDEPTPERWVGPLYARRPSDERLFLTPTPLAMRPGAVSISIDELVSPRAAVGIARHFQLDLRIGGMVVPGALGGPLPLVGGLAAGGGAGIALIGMFDVGVKIPLVEEGENLPAITIGYDMLDVFGLAAGGAGLVIVGGGAAAEGLVAVGGANLQFNLFSIEVGKHFPNTRDQMIVGTYVLDNHHFLPQKATFASACGAGGVGTAGENGKVEECASATTTIDRLPLQVQPFVGYERAIGDKNSFIAEVLFTTHVENTMGTTGFRWAFGVRDIVNMRIDTALVWTNRGYPLPWLGLGLHFR